MTAVVASFDASSLVNVLIGLLGGGSLAGGIVAFLKLKPEANTAAVAQATQALEMMRSLNNELETALRRAHARINDLEAEVDRLSGLVDTLQRRIASLPLSDAARLAAEDPPNR